MTAIAQSHFEDESAFARLTAWLRSHAPWETYGKCGAPASKVARSAVRYCRNRTDRRLAHLLASIEECRLRGLSIAPISPSVRRVAIAAMAYVEFKDEPRYEAGMMENLASAVKDMESGTQR